MAENGNGKNGVLQRWVLGVSGSVATAAIVAAAAFSFATSKSVAVMGEQMRSAHEKLSELSVLRERVRLLELEVARLNRERQ